MKSEEIQVGSENKDAQQRPRTLTIPTPGAGAATRADVPPAVTPELGAKVDLDDPRRWDAIADELLGREFDTLQGSLRAFEEKHRNAGDVGQLDHAIDFILDNGGAKPDGKGEQKEDRETLAKFFRDAVHWPSYAVVLTTYLYARYLKHWEDSSDWPGIRRLIEATKSALESPKGGAPIDALEDRDPGAAAIVRSVLDLIEAIDQAMEVESGLNCSCPVTMKDAAEKVAAKAQGVLDRVGAGPHEGRVAFVHARASIDLHYFSAVAQVGDAVCDYIDNTVDLSTKVRDVTRHVTNVEERIKGDVYESELRSHRLGLESLSVAWPRLHVDLANVIYCYPFAVPWADPLSLIEAVKSFKGKIPGQFAGLTASVDHMVLTDMWKSSDNSGAEEEGLFSGVTLAFGADHDPRVKTTAQRLLPEENIPDEVFSIEIRLSRLGNHYLRLQRRLENASIHDLNQAMRRAMQQMGDETVLFGEPPHEWPRLFELAHDLINWVVMNLEPYVLKDEVGVTRHPRLPSDPKKRATLLDMQAKRAAAPTVNAIEPSNGPLEDAKSKEAAKITRKAYPHVIVTARKLSLERRIDDDSNGTHGQEDSDLAKDKLLEVARGAALLVHPVPYAAAVLEEWSRYSVPRFDDGDIMQPMSFAGNFAYRTSNTTFGLLRGTPEYLIMEHEEASEFVASLPVLLESWMGRIRERADKSLEELSEEASPVEINNRQLQLRRILTTATSVIAQIHSPDLCLTAVHRKYLDQMFQIAGIERLETELQSHFNVLDAHLNTLSAMAERKEKERQDKAAFWFGAGAVLVGVPSLAGLLQLLDAGQSWRGHDETGQAAFLLLIFVVLAFALSKLPGAPPPFRKTLRAPYVGARWLALRIRGMISGSWRKSGTT